MSDTTVLAFAIGLLAVVFGLLMTVLGWIGNKLYSKVEEMNKSIQTMVSELHARLTDHESRIVRIETIEESCPASPSRRKTDKKE